MAEGSRTADPIPKNAPFVGRAIPHESADLHVTGGALYADDLSVPGVVRVLTVADVPGRNDTGCSREDEPLFLPSP